MTIKKVLALAPHTDDIELGCSGFLSKLKKQSAQIDAVSFSAAQPLSVGNPVEEFKDAMSILNIDGEFLDFKPRYFHEKRQDILDYLWNRNKDNIPIPELIHSHGNVRIAHCLEHPCYGDHGMICSECRRAYANSVTLPCYSKEL